MACKENITMNVDVRNIDECPLGIVDCMPTKPNHLRPWLSCRNSEYCQRVTEAWEIPLIIVPIYSRERGAGSFQKVKLTYRYPHNYSNASYKAYMKKYGYAEAIGLQYHRWHDGLLVQWNILKFGFAEAVPLEFDVKNQLIPNHLNRYKAAYGAMSCYSQDSEGLWWYGDRRSLKQILK